MGGACHVTELWLSYTTCLRALPWHTLQSGGRAAYTSWWEGVAAPPPRRVVCYIYLLEFVAIKINLARSWSPRLGACMLLTYEQPNAAV